MTPAQFRKSAPLREALAEVLERSCVQRALAVLRENGEPVEFLIPPGVDFMAFNATQNTRREGYFQALRALEQLAQPLVEPPKTKDLMPSLMDDPIYGSQQNHAE
jgi:hypothetical protein